MFHLSLLCSDLQPHLAPLPMALVIQAASSWLPTNKINYTEDEYTLHLGFLTAELYSLDPSCMRLSISLDKSKIQDFRNPVFGASRYMYM